MLANISDATGVHLMNHIDEGLFILKKIGASELAKRAYAIHPILQGDDEFAGFWASEEVTTHTYNVADE